MVPISKFMRYLHRKVSMSSWLVVRVPLLVAVPSVGSRLSKGLGFRACILMLQDIRLMFG